MKLKKIFWASNTIPGCKFIPVSMHDERLDKYKPKFSVPKFNPYKTPIAKKYASELETPGVSGATLIDDGVSAFVIRAAFARMATKTIDLQTYIYSNDFSARVLISELRAAADRGVKIRILVDDYGTKSDIADVILLNKHPNIEVKIFNAIKNRTKLLYYPQILMDFNRLNSRMHNKLFIVDGIAMITGGRNIGSNYFMPETASNFSDTDVLFIGKIAQDAVKSFNEYWNYHRAIPASIIPRACSGHEMQKIKHTFRKIKKQTRKNTKKYDSIITKTQRDFNQKKFDFCWGNGTFLADAPGKIEMTMHQKENYRGQIIKTLVKLWCNTRKSAHISAAYFVPGRGGLDTIIKEEKSGVHITIVTNSLASTNAPTVYGKWEKYRNTLIDSGADIYEFMLSAENRRGRPHDRERKQSSFSVLHSKTMVFDDKIAWIGSFNLDPRSAFYNTENVAIFECDEFAKKLKNMILGDTETSWHVTKRGKRTVWTGLRPGNEHPKSYYHTPDTTIFRRLLKNILKIIPEKFV